MSNQAQKEKAINFLELSLVQLISEMSMHQGRARIHAPTMAAVLTCLEHLKKDEPKARGGKKSSAEK